MIVSIAKIKVKSPLNLIPFLRHAKMSEKQALDNPECIHVEKGKGKGLYFYTVTAWQTEGALKEYYTTGEHGEAMKNIANLGSEISSIRLKRDTIPSFEEACNLIDKEGKVRYLNN